MMFDTLRDLLIDPIPSTTLPNIHPQDIDCVVRSEMLTTGSLYVGNIQSVQNRATLNKLKVSSILTSAEGYKLDHPQQLIRYYKYHPMPEYISDEMNHYFDQAVTFIQLTLKKTNCIVHCLTGLNKSIAIIIAYLMNNYSLSFNDAYSSIFKIRKLINISHQYSDALKNYENYLIAKRPKYEQKLKTQRVSTKKYTQQSKISQNLPQKESSKLYINNQTEAKQSKYSRKQSQLSIYENNNTQQKMLSQASKISVKNSNSKTQNQLFSLTQKSVQKNKTILNESQINRKQTNQFNESPEHKQALRFSKLVSSAHNQFIGVKREHKNVSSSLKKQKNTVLQNSKVSNQKKITQISRQRSKSIGGHEGQTASKGNKLQIKNCYKTQLSVHDDNNRSKINYSAINPMINIKATSVRNKSQYANPEDDEFLEKYSKKSNLSFNASQKVNHQQLSASKVEIFSSLNKQINQNIDFILNNYESQMNEVRNTYHDALRKLRFNHKNSKTNEIKRS